MKIMNSETRGHYQGDSPVAGINTVANQIMKMKGPLCMAFVISMEKSKNSKTSCKGLYVLNRNVLENVKCFIKKIFSYTVVV